MGVIAPVCGKLGEKEITFPNRCWADCKKADILSEGKCDEKA